MTSNNVNFQPRTDQAEVTRARIIENMKGFSELLLDYKIDIGYYIIQHNNPSMALAIFSSHCEHTLGRSGNIEKDQKYISVIEDLIALGADANYDPAGRTHQPLLSESEKGNLDAVKLLLKNGAKVDGSKTLWNYVNATPLMVAAGAGHEAVVKTLIEAGAKIQKKDLEDNRAIDYATANKRPGVIALLSKKGTGAPKCIQ